MHLDIKVECEFLLVTKNTYRSDFQLLNCDLVCAIAALVLSYATVWFVTTV